MIPSAAEEFAEAIAEAKPSPNEIAMLQWHYSAPSRLLTAARLSELMEWGGQSANAHYGRFAGRVAANLRWNPNDEDRYWPDMKVSCLVVGDRPSVEYEWTLRPQVANAMEELGWVTPDRHDVVHAHQHEPPERSVAKLGLLAEGRRVWIKSYWDFSTRDTSYLGFSREADRERFLRLHRPGDLVLVYGAVSEETAKDDRRQALGFLEVDPIEVSDRERSSEEAIKEKVGRGWGDRWIYGVPVRRAWEVQRRIQIKYIATTTYRYERARAIASQGEILTEQEAALALTLPVKPLNVYLEPRVRDAETVKQLGKLLSPSRGIKPSFGSRTMTTEDGDHFLYLMQLSGELQFLLGRDRLTLVKKILVKVGYSNNLKRRLAELNSGIPLNATIRWRGVRESKAFSNAQAAFDAEGIAKLELGKAGESLGGEFFLGAEDKLLEAFNKAAARAAFIISAP